jgi:serine phosphatase RsbU (regulator of sigma subunit)
VKSLIAVPLQTNNDVIGLIYLDTPHIIAPFTEDDLSLLTVMANVAAIRLEHARLAVVEQAERLMQRDLEQAGEIQRGLLPIEIPRADGLEVSGFNEPCRTVGGDYYDFFPYPDGKLAVVLADVAGKGMPAALMMSGLHARTHLLLEDPTPPAAFLTRLNRAMVGFCPANRFITMAAVLIDPLSGDVLYSSAGHNPAVLIRSNGSAELIKDSGLILGILKVASYEDRRITLDDGDMLVLYSDGITEATREGQDEEFGEDRLCRVLSANAHLPASQLVDVVLRARNYFTDNAPNFDDATLVIVRRGEPKGPRTWGTLDGGL